MTTTRQRHNAKFKARVVLEALRGDKTLKQLGSQYGVHPVQIAHWRKAALEHLEEGFVDGRSRKGRDREIERDALYEQIGRLKMELEWIKKKLVCRNEDRRDWVEANHPQLSVRRQCALLGISRGSLYYQAAEESQKNLELMRVIDRQYTRVPF